MLRAMRVGHLATVLVVFAATRLIGCGTTIEAASFDQSCTRATDCVAIGVGDPCSTSCVLFPSEDAIARTDYAAYREQAISAQYSCSHCGSLQGCGDTLAAPTSAYCVNQRCTVCDSSDPCTCAPHDPSCVDGAFLVDAGIEEAAAPGDAKSPSDAANPGDGATTPEATAPDAAHEATAGDP
jgi:hypothetical protein